MTGVCVCVCFQGDGVEMGPVVSAGQRDKVIITPTFDLVIQ